MSRAARLDAELVRRGLVRSRAQAVDAVAAGRVDVDGSPARRPSQPVDPGAVLAVRDVEPWVARSAHKLIAALDAFGIDPAGRLCLDVGASTGGFTQVLLARGAREVIALDVGHDQLAPVVRADPRVRVVEGANARALDPRSLTELSGTAEAPTLAVIDVSFIPLRLVLGPVAGVLRPEGRIAALVKPQFEVGRTRVRHGLVPGRDDRHAAVRAVIDAAAGSGLAAEGVIASPLEGTAGNREYLCALGRAPGADPTQWEAQLAALD